MNWLIAVAGGFAGGVLLRPLFVFGWEPVAFAFLLVVLFGGAWFMTPRLAYSLGAAFCIFLALGMWRADVADTSLPKVFTQDLRHRVAYDAIVVDDPDVREKNQRIALRIYKGDAKTGALAVMPLSAQVEVGDRVRVYGTLTLPQAFETENGRTFRYDKYLEARGIHFLVQYGAIYTESAAPWYSLPAALARVKHWFLDGLRAALPEPHSALAGGIVIGGKSGLGAELKQGFILSGLIHIVVLSGYNVMVVATWVMAFFTFLFAKAELVTRLRIPRVASIILGALALLLFVGIAGFSTTAIRAMAMALIALYARATGRTYAAGRALFLVVFLMLLWNPLYLAFDPGFGLSVAATAGLIWLAPIIEKFLAFIRSAFWKEIFVTTLAAQTAVLPLLLYNTGIFSLVALPANLIAAPAVPLSMGFAALAGLMGTFFGSFAPIVATVFGFPAYLITSYLIAIAETASALPFSTFALAPFSFAFVLLAYAALIFIASSKRFSTTPQLRLAKNAST